MIERIAELTNNKVIDDISDIRDESDRDGMRIVVELKRGAEAADRAQPALQAHADAGELQHDLPGRCQQPAQGNGPGTRRSGTSSITALTWCAGVPHSCWQKAKDREHILEGYRLALDHIDNVIAIIRGSADRANARDNLIAYFAGKKIDINTTGRAPKLDPEKPFTLKQADAILELQLHRLTRLSIDEIVKELESIKGEIAEYESILGSEKKLRNVIVKELEEIKKEYGDARRTQIVDETTEIQLEDLIVDEQVAVTVSHAGYLKRTPITTYRSQRRGGTGRRGMSTREEDFVERLYIASTHAYLLVFTNTGRVYWLKVYEIPDVGRRR